MVVVGTGKARFVTAVRSVGEIVLLPEMVSLIVALAVRHPPPFPPPVMAMGVQGGRPRPPVWRVWDGCGYAAKGGQVGCSGCQHPPWLVEATNVRGASTHNPVPHRNTRTMLNSANLLLPQQLNTPTRHVILSGRHLLSCPHRRPIPPHRRGRTSVLSSAPPPVREGGDGI